MIGLVYINFCAKCLPYIHRDRGRIEPCRIIIACTAVDYVLDTRLELTSERPFAVDIDHHRLRQVHEAVVEIYSHGA